ncbi:hypothetical protein QDR11_15385 [Clostridium perfringens]|uniref:hypothetical protein n=1 Tax=Clostridium perfringens TaxID=1502 RepID=UPI00244C23EB|nr:hypothetical protein [Clostridium perfringens]MDH2472878.1 hypothetical protein [Clostridium perfringens]MDU6697716.1 hypothetical protein [Clostridium perfringens]
MEEIINIVAHHGTSYEGEKGILRTRKFESSMKDNEWLGHGIYFFHDKNSKENGELWAKNYKKFKFYSIIEAELKANKEKILDLDNAEWQEFFHEFRSAQLKVYKSKGINIVDNCNNSIKLDCKLIDDITNKVGFDLVKQRRYIELRERNGDKLIGSHIPNCSILCVKNNNIIDKNSIKCIGRGGIK